MPDYVKYDNLTNRVTNIYRSVSENSPVIDGVPNILKVETIPNVIMKHLKVNGTAVEEMTQQEKDVVTQEETDAEALSLQERLDKFDVTNLELITALVQAINTRIPNNPITRQEIIDKLKDNR